MGKPYWTFETFENGLETVWKEYQIIARAKRKAL